MSVIAAVLDGKWVIRLAFGWCDKERSEVEDVEHHCDRSGQSYETKKPLLRGGQELVPEELGQGTRVDEGQAFDVDHDVARLEESLVEHSAQSVDTGAVELAAEHHMTLDVDCGSEHRAGLADHSR
jgi:hypothetical protein